VRVRNISVGVLQCVTVCYSVLQCAAVRRNVSQCVAVSEAMCLGHCSEAVRVRDISMSVLQCIAVHGDLLQCVAVRCSVLQCAHLKAHMGGAAKHPCLGKVVAELAAALVLGIAAQN